MKIKNQLFLKKPWLFPILSVIGVALALLTNSGEGLSLQTKVAIGGAVILSANVWFFWALAGRKRGLRMAA